MSFLSRIKTFFTKKTLIKSSKDYNTIQSSNYISRDLSWMDFNRRVLYQAKMPNRNLFDKLKFLAICCSNIDEFFQIRVGSLYNYIDFKKERIDYCGLPCIPFKKRLYREVNIFFEEMYALYKNEIKKEFTNYGFTILRNSSDLTREELQKVSTYFEKTIYPMLTPMLIDTYHVFPIILNKLLYFGVITINFDKKDKIIRQLSFLQIPNNIPRFYQIERGNQILLLPVEEIIRENISSLYRNVEIESATLFRIIRNGDFSVEESDDTDSNLVEEMKRNIKKRKTGRVVRIDIENKNSSYLISFLKKRNKIEDENIFGLPDLMDFTAFWQLYGKPEFQKYIPKTEQPVLPLTCDVPVDQVNMFQLLKNQDIFLHHPYNSFDYVLKLLDDAAIDPNVLAIKITIYRLAKNSRITKALLKAAETGKHVSVLFEVKARFDEEHNISEAQKLQKAGCFVIYGLGNVKTHCKLLMIIRKEDDSDNITRFVHLSSGNYNESTANLYTDTGLLSSKEEYAADISELFNVITGHSKPFEYSTLITEPNDMREELIHHIHHEIENHEKGKKSGIMIKVNSLQDKSIIDELYKASNAGVSVKLIIRGICCIRPGRKNVSENVYVKSIVGDFLEHSRIYYFNNGNDPVIYCGSADVMVRSFERRIECLFEITDDKVKKEIKYMLKLNLDDTVNSFELDESGIFSKVPVVEGQKEVNLHEEFFKVTKEIVYNAEVELF